MSNARSSHTPSSADGWRRTALCSCNFCFCYYYFLGHLNRHRLGRSRGRVRFTFSQKPEPELEAPVRQRRLARSDTLNSCSNLHKCCVLWPRNNWSIIESRNINRWDPISIVMRINWSSFIDNYKRRFALSGYASCKYNLDRKLRNINDGNFIWALDPSSCIFAAREMMELDSSRFFDSTVNKIFRLRLSPFLFLSVHPLNWTFRSKSSRSLIFLWPSNVDRVSFLAVFPHDVVLRFWLSLWRFGDCLSM